VTLFCVRNLPPKNHNLNLCDQKFINSTQSSKINEVKYIISNIIKLFFS
jgi:hypothetical protein